VSVNARVTAARQPKKDSVGVKKLPMFGKIEGKLAGGTTNHCARVPPYWPTDVVGIPPVVSGVVRTAESELCELTLDILAGNPSSHDDVIAAPSMVGATIRAPLKRAANFCFDLLGQIGLGLQSAVVRCTLKRLQIGSSEKGG
jgi:hypothetical protein